MAISTSGDLILDVVRAADPASVDAARARLASFAGRAGAAQFSVAAQASPAAPHNAPDKAPGGKAATPEAFARFEAMVLQTFIQSMLPQDSEAVYGEGMAGEMWQAMLAEQLGATMARRGGIGIADRILRDHYVSNDEKMPVQGVSADPDRPALDEQRLMASALIHEFQRRAVNAIDGQQQPSSPESSQPPRVK